MFFFSNCPLKEIKEKIYESPFPGDKLIDVVEAVDEKVINVIAPGYGPLFGNANLSKVAFWPFVVWSKRWTIILYRAHAIRFHEYCVATPNDSYITYIHYLLHHLYTYHTYIHITYHKTKLLTASVCLSKREEAWALNFLWWILIPSLTLPIQVFLKYQVQIITLISQSLNNKIWLMTLIKVSMNVCFMVCD